MALVKDVVIDRIEILENNVIQIRQVKRVTEDGEVLAEKYHRYVLSPNDDISNQPERVKAVCKAVWK